jgi:NADH dehydrogenase FAD-containing subunit
VLRWIEDATDIRRRIPPAFEEAENMTDGANHGRRLTFVVIGGGPTGVDLAGAIVELARKALARDFRRIDPADARGILIETGARLLPALPEKLSAFAGRSPEKLGAYLAGAIGRMLRHERRPAPFRYRHLGSMATIGRRSAVADFGWIRVSGLAAWLLWGVVHILFLIGFRNRITILVEWLWAYVTFQRGARLITRS